ncbi:glycerol-3-phosphate dehydrogenase/oxidase [Shewanella schlegeliana]|uniref:Glycerol-3-phosphate dehydrogenase/oxidase n=1 Tax=Shewanella schlegeliana TaxID=190308 RepID=A0ABS1T0M2_9GAMM|nr:glycerol-3-phosphate dehydrogenase/oxidase [Shewanella schlegeliana]MBL4914332.1 glycerol-3-phosphate dehydrogenase/oxidase [Shewanella schlegeliana]MCL1109445.1 glycerol-3-phosphate dehydrogenase/oxidase [Shewanella schlegeliana]GIU37282.1 FAD-dependent glycerol-3-phosphate dehydrogenase [Shewanella schlegeliana]
MNTLSQAAKAATDAIIQQAEYDLIIIGGGITGAGIFHLAAEQGAKVLLLEQSDFAWGTSSRSSKMVHGGLRYLATGQWRMTRDAAREREVMLAQLPGLVDLMPYMMLHKRGDFPSAALFQRVLAIYDKLAGSKHHRPLSIEKARTWLSELSFDGINGVSLFADGVTDDARLVLRALQDGVLAGGQALNYAKVTGLIERGENQDNNERVSGVRLTLANTLDNQALAGKEYSVKAKCVINATGSWAGKLHALQDGSLRPLRGSHLVLPFERLPVSACLTFYHPQDGRPVYIYPWQGCSVIGTTDLDHHDKLESEPGIAQQEVDYLLGLARHYFPKQQLEERDVVSCWSGIRPIYSASQPDRKGKGKDPSKESREHIIWSKPGLISVTGGKLTSYHLMAKETLAQVQQQLPNLFSAELKRAPFSQATQGYADEHLRGYFGHFAPQISEMKNARMIGISRCQWRELEWSLVNESVVHLDDLLLRRTRLALLLGSEINQYREAILSLCCQHLAWSKTKAESEWLRFDQIMNTSYRLPSQQEKRECL